MKISFLGTVMISLGVFLCLLTTSLNHLLIISMVVFRNTRQISLFPLSRQSQPLP